MNLPLRPAVATLQGLLSWATTLASSIAASWDVNHQRDGRHKFEWVQIPYSATRFDSGSTMTWGVDSSDQLLLEYRIVGDACTVKWRIATSDCSGGNNELRIRLPDGVFAARRASGLHYYDDAGTEGVGLARINAGLTHIQLYKSSTAANWTATTSDNSYTEGSLEFPITQ